MGEEGGVRIMEIVYENETKCCFNIDTIVHCSMWC